MHASSANVSIAAYWMAASDADADVTRLSNALGIPVITPLDEPLAYRLGRVRRIRELGGRALVGVAGAADAWLHMLTNHGSDFAWEIDPTTVRPAEDLDEVVQASLDRLVHIRLVGGGPEAAMQEGRGIGAFMGRLALLGYDGPLVLTPSSPRYRVAWATWLGRRGAWGCGSKVSRNDTVPLSPGGGVR